MRRLSFLVWLSLMGLMVACSTSNLNKTIDEQDDGMATEAVQQATEQMVGQVSQEENESFKKRDRKQNKPTTWKRDKIQPNTSKLAVGDTEELPLKGTQIKVQIDGFRARVLMDLFYYNDKNWNLEGTFKLRLPNEASPYFFAFGETVFLDKKQPPFEQYETMADFDTDPEAILASLRESTSHTKEARIVPKEKAALAYTSTVRRQIDPALMEWAGADVFNCRVFPLMPKKLHHIVVGYDVNLTDLEGDKIFKLPLPDTDAPLTVDLSLAKLQGKKPTISPNIRLKNAKGHWKAHFENVKTREISVRYDALEHVFIQSETNYFAGTINPALPSTENILTSKYATFLVDVSLSSNPDKFNVWLKLLEATLNNNRAAIEKFSVVFFNVEATHWKPDWTNNTSENVTALMEYCNTLVLEGATDLGVGLAATNHNQHLRQAMRHQNIFLLSDAAVTWGEAGIYALAKKMNPDDRLFAYRTGFSGTDMNVLKHLTRTTGGAVFSVVSESQVKAASTAFRKTPWRIEAVTVSAGNDVLIAGRPQFLYEQQKLLIVGRGQLTSATKLTLKLRQGTTEKTLNIPIRQLIESDLATRTYGQIATNQLEEFDYLTEQYAISYATHFSIPGKTCSFLMLETEQDYQNFNIKPEQEAFVVQSKTVTSILKVTLKNLGNLLANAKAAFKNWIQKLTTTPGMQFEKNMAFDLLLERIPERNFDIPSKGLKTEQKTKTQLSKSYLSMLNAKELSYDELTAESKKRQNTQNGMEALKVLSSLVEKNAGDGVLLRDVGYSAMEFGLNQQAYWLFKRVLETRPYEPQTYHAIAQLLTEMDKIDLAVLYYEIAILTQWNGRFGDFQIIAGLDYLRLLNQIQSQKYQVSFPNYIEPRIKELSQKYAEHSSDLLITIMWNTDNTDIDLHVIEPTGEKCYYKNPNTKIGGQLTRDVTTGYGPEMYRIQKAKKGNYKIKVKYYSSNRNRMGTRSKVYATVYENWGTQNEQVIKKVVTLKSNKKVEDILTVKLK